MQIAVISDVHANHAALSAVLTAIEDLGVERIWCLGDTLGYGPDVDICLRLVLARCEMTLLGNHDLAVRGDYPARHFGGTAGAGVHYALDHLDPDLFDRLAPLSPQAVINDIELFHASSIDPAWEYVNDRRSAAVHLSAQSAPLAFVGHSHLQLAYALQPDGSAVGDILTDGGSLMLDERRTVVNPGSVGQPRDGDPRAGFATYDPAKRRVEWHRVEYDIAQAQFAIRAAGLPERTATRLATGR